MKVKVKGLVFVGFAAMIFAANAMAANENTVTSKSFTEATYQKKATADYKVSKSDGTWNDLATEVTENGANAVTAGAIKTYVDTAISNAGAPSGDAFELTSHKLDGTSGNTIGSTTASNDTTMYPSAAAVKEYVAGQLEAQNQLDDGEYQPQTQNNYQLGGAGGTWSALSGGFANGTYTTKTADANGVVTIDANATTDGTLPAADANKLPTASAVKTYVDNKATSDLSGKQDKTTATSGYKVGNSDGTWADMGSAVTAATGGYVSVTGGTDGAAVAINIDNSKIDTTVTSGSSNLVTSDAVADAIGDAQTTAGSTYQIKSTAASIGGTDGTWTPVDTSVTSTGTSVPTTTAVYNAIQTATGGNTIPGQNPAVCNNATYNNAPCALVAESDGLHWRTMATADHPGGVDGNAQ